MREDFLILRRLLKTIKLHKLETSQLWVSEMVDSYGEYIFQELIQSTIY